MDVVTSIDAHSPAAQHPIFRLPEELLSYCFSKCLEGPLTAYKSSNAQATLTVVCRRWRNVALSTPRLWSHLRFSFFLGNCREATLQQLSVLRRCLDRSGCSPLTYSLEVTDDVLWSESSFDPFMELMTEHAYHWSDVIIQGFSGSLSTRYFNRSFPLLKRLSVWGMHFQWPGRYGEAPFLNSICLPRKGCVDDSIPWSHLRSAYVWDFVLRSYIASDMAQLLESVDHHGLEELSIWNDLNDNNIPPPVIDLSHLIPPGKTIFLPQLTYFSLHTYCTYSTVDLFKYLSLPSLTTFCIAQWTSDVDFTVFTQLLMFLARNARNLRVLELGPDCEPRDPFDEHQMHFWGLLQSVECLRLRTEVRATITFIASLCRYNAQRSSDFSTPTSGADPWTVRLKDLTLSIDSQTVEEEIGSLHLLVDALVLLIPARTTTTSETHKALQPAASFDAPPFKLLLRIGEGKIGWLRRNPRRTWKSWCRIWPQNCGRYLDI